MKHVSMIFAISKDRKIGDSATNDMPWPRLSKDLAYFAKLTKDLTVIMGRKTFDSLPFPKLPGRRIVVVTSTKIPGIHCIGIEQLESFLHACTDQIFIIGGKRMFETCYKYADTIYATRVLSTFPEADISLDLDSILQDFELTYSSVKYKDNGVEYRFQKFNR